MLALQTSIMMWRQIFTFVQSAMLNILAHPWGVRIWAIAGADCGACCQCCGFIRMAVHNACAASARAQLGVLKMTFNYP